jgi:hypothetical protein
MTLKTRKILFIIFILAFVIITPLVSLYAAGYQIGQNFSIQKTGILVVKTTPGNAAVKLENKTQKKLVADLLPAQENKPYTTPNKIKGLLPGEYDIAISKDGFWPWNKKLTINPGQSIYLENLTLFKNSQPTLLSQKNYLNIVASPNKTSSLAIYKDGVDLINLENGSVTNIDLDVATSSQVLPGQCQWTQNSNRFFISGVVYDVSDLKPKNLNKQLNKKLNQLQWDYNNSDILYYYEKNAIYSYNLTTNQNELALNVQNINNFFARGNDFFTISQEGNASILTLWDLGGKNVVRKINLPLADYTFINKNHKLINLFDQTHKIIYLIDPLAEIKPVVEVISNVDYTAWYNDNTLIFANSFELWIYDLNNTNKYLITRFGEEINGVAAFTNEFYLLYSTANNINVLELDARDKYNISKLAAPEKTNGFFLSPDGKTLYFSGIIDNRAGVYKLEIQ